jgi:AAA15 family ATPase/GTPase
MKIVQVRVANFRGIAQGTVHFNGHSVLVGDNNAGKSTLLEAIDQFESLCFCVQEVCPTRVSTGGLSHGLCAESYALQQL